MLGWITTKGDLSCMPHRARETVNDESVTTHLPAVVLQAVARPFAILSSGTGEALHTSPQFRELLQLSAADVSEDPARWMEGIDSPHRTRLLEAIQTGETGPAFDCTVGLPDGGCRSIRFEIVRRDRKALSDRDWISITAEDTSNQARLERATYRLQLHQEVLNDLAIGLGRSTSLDYIYACIHEHVTQLMDTASFIVSLYDADRQTLRAGFIFADGVTIDPMLLPPLQLSDPGEGTQRQVVRTRRPLNVPDLSVPLEGFEPQVEILENERVIPSASSGASDDERSTKSELLAPMLLEGEVVGVIALQSYRRNAYSSEDMELLCGIANLTAMAVHHVTLVQSLTDSAQRLDQALQETIEMVARTTEMRDPYTAAHQERVARLAVAIARRLGVSEHTVEGLRVAGLLHDIGKLSIPYDILSKSAALSPEEFDMVRHHAYASAHALEGISFDAPVREIVMQHHENVDGSGYPARLTGDDILFEARILRVADTVEAMTAHRPYRPAYDVQEALEELLAGVDCRYDAAVVEACLGVFADGFCFEENPSAE